MAQMINNIYNDQWPAITQRLNTQGFVVLHEFLTEQPTIPQNTHPSYKPDMHKYKLSATPKEIIDGLTELAEHLEADTQPVHTRIFEQGDYTLQHSDTPYNGLELTYIHTEGEIDRGELTYVDEEPYIIPAHPNTAIIVFRNTHMRQFIKKLTHHTTGKMIVSSMHIKE